MVGTVFSVTSNDTLTLNGNVFTDFADDDITKITFPNALVTRKTGKNGNTMFAQNAAGLNCDLELRLMRGSADDQFMQNLINTAPADFPSTVLLAGTFVKRIGNGVAGATSSAPNTTTQAGNVVSDTYTLSGGVISRLVDGKENVSGDTSQAVSIYNIIFAAGQRTIG